VELLLKKITALEPSFPELSHPAGGRPSKGAREMPFRYRAKSGHNSEDFLKNRLHPPCENGLLK
jgi:hypothetical protein